MYDETSLTIGEGRNQHKWKFLKHDNLLNLSWVFSHYPLYGLLTSGKNVVS